MSMMNISNYIFHHNTFDIMRHKRLDLHANFAPKFSLSIDAFCRPYRECDF